MSAITAHIEEPAGIRHLRLYNFRNYAELNLELGPGLNVFTGSNAQGKSNLLEAVATLLLVRSPRTPSPGDLLRWGTDEAAVDAVVARPPVTETLGLRLQRQTTNPAVSSPSVIDVRARVTRTSLAEGRPVAAREILGRCPVVLFWPDDLQLVKSGPEARRRLVDTLLSQLDRRAGDDLVRYRRVLEQRNALLRQIRHGASAEQLAAFDEALVHHGARVQMARARTVGSLGPLAAAAMRELTGGQEVLGLRYRPDSSVGGADEEAIIDSLRTALRRSRDEELSRGITVVGPHRDDVDYLIDDRPARISASQGQQRSAVLATKLAELRYAQIRSGHLPILLLDDVLSELDPDRGAHLLDALTTEELAPQTLITSTDHPRLEGRFGRRFEVRGGMITPR